MRYLAFRLYRVIEVYRETFTLQTRPQTLVLFLAPEGVGEQGQFHAPAAVATVAGLRWGLSSFLEEDDDDPASRIVRTILGSKSASVARLVQSACCPLVGVADIRNLPIENMTRARDVMQRALLRGDGGAAGVRASAGGGTSDEFAFTDDDDDEEEEVVVDDGLEVEEEEEASPCGPPGPDPADLCTWQVPSTPNGCWHTACAVTVHALACVYASWTPALQTWQCVTGWTSLHPLAPKAC
jgi:hypothetical protein